MTVKIDVLVIEDDDDQFSTYEDGAEEFGETSGVNIELIRGKSVSDAVPLLFNQHFDGAIIDLNLDSEKPEEASGNTILEIIKKSRRFPVLVVSGNLGNIDQAHKDDESALFQLLDRDLPNREIFSKIYGIHKTGITDILGRRGGIEEKLSDIFWKHLAKDMDSWMGRENQTNAFLRYTISHLLEYLDLPVGDERNIYNEAEFYIKPPIRDHIAPGDIVKKGVERFVVLSPACDIAVRKIRNDGKPEINAKRITLAKIIGINREDFLLHEIIRDGDNSPKRESILSEIVKGQNAKYVLLPKYLDLAQGVVDLQNLYTIDVDEFVDDYVRQATISAPFLKDIQAKMSSYHGRQGQPDLDKKTLIKQYKAGLSPNQ